MKFLWRKLVLHNWNDALAKLVPIGHTQTLFELEQRLLFEIKDGLPFTHFITDTSFLWKQDRSKAFLLTYLLMFYPFKGRVWHFYLFFPRWFSEGRNMIRCLFPFETEILGMSCGLLILTVCKLLPLQSIKFTSPLRRPCWFVHIVCFFLLQWLR